MKYEHCSEARQEQHELDSEKILNTNGIKMPVPHNQDALDKAEEIVEEIVDAALEQNTPTNWMEWITPFLKPGGKPVAIILALGAISIPLAAGGSVWVASILAIGASIVGILALL